MTSAPRHIGRVIRALRRARGWSQLALAEKADLHINTVHNFERQPPHGTAHATLKQLAGALGVSPDVVEMLVEKLDEQGNLSATYLLPEEARPAVVHYPDSEQKWLIEAIELLEPAERERLRRWVAGMLLERKAAGAEHPPSRPKR